MLDRLSEALTNAGVPMERVEGVIGAPVLVFQDVATQQQRDAAASIVASFDWSVATDAAWRAAKQQQADSMLLEQDGIGVPRVVRAFVLVTVDELNNIREWITAFKAQVAAATNLSNLQTRIAALPDLPDRTGQQARTAITNKINAGSADQ